MTAPVLQNQHALNREREMQLPELHDDIADEKDKAMDPIPTATPNLYESFGCVVIPNFQPENDVDDMEEKVDYSSL